MTFICLRLDDDNKKGQITDGGIFICLSIYQLLKLNYLVIFLLKLIGSDLSDNFERILNFKNC